MKEKLVKILTNYNEHHNVEYFIDFTNELKGVEEKDIKKFIETKKLNANTNKDKVIAIVKLYNYLVEDYEKDSIECEEK